MTKRLLIYAGAFLALPALGIGVWVGVTHWQTAAASERYRRLTTCRVPGCRAGTECAISCAREFLDRNGYGDPTLARRDELVFDVVEAMHGGDVDAILAARANSLNRTPAQICELPKGGYSLFFSDLTAKTGRGELLAGRMLLMNGNLGDIHLLHEHVLMFRDGRARTDSCTFLE